MRTREAHGPTLMIGYAGTDDRLRSSVVLYTLE